jgi:hypothetical protein
MPFNVSKGNFQVLGKVRNARRADFFKEMVSNQITVKVGEGDSRRSPLPLAGEGRRGDGNRHGFHVLQADFQSHDG